MAGVVSKRRASFELGALAVDGNATVARLNDD
jgi:hypothetical protein